MGEHEIPLISAAIGFSGIPSYAIRPEMVAQYDSSLIIIPDTLSAGININNHIYDVPLSITIAIVFRVGKKVGELSPAIRIELLLL